MSSTKESLIKIEEGRASKDVLNKPEINILCFDLTPYSSLTQFGCCCIFVFVCYLAYGYFLELIFTDDSVVSLYITLVQFLLTTSFSYVESLIRIRLKGNSLSCVQTMTRIIIKRKVPIRTYAILAGLTLGTMAFSNLALSYLNYPTQLIFKSCKLIPVMIGSIIIQGKRYGFLDYTAAVVMCAGLTLFTLADSKTSPHFDILGVIIICLALLCDAVIGNVQEKAMKQYQADNNEVVFFSYAIAFIYLFIFALFSGVLEEGYDYCLMDPVTSYRNIFLLSMSGYLGLQAVLSLLRICGAPITVTVTTMRKALSIIFSFLLFSKPFVFQYLWSGMLVVLAIYLNMYSKKHPSYVPAPVLRCWQLLQGFYQSEYRYLQIKSKMYSDTV